ncbi:MAG TPA: hypothetical protein VF174_10015 [Micromonosporaceae bacterium]
MASVSVRSLDVLAEGVWNYRDQWPRWQNRQHGAGAKTEYWPHPGVPLPEEVPGLRDWWAQAVDQLRLAAAS